MALIREILRQLLNDFILRQHAFDTARQRMQCSHNTVLQRFTFAFQAAEVSHQHQQNSQLSSECLGGGHTDFSPGFGHHSKIRFTHQ
ncbi:Uncharacterised protein [Klebsiella pneumoniae]|nr:Uncharacterised protein [Klebsiella pneumoniae]